MTPRAWLDSPSHRRWLETETDRLLGFAPAAAAPGGFGWLDQCGGLDRARGVQLWINCRMTHVAALGSLLGRPGCAGLLEHGMRSLAGPLRDDARGGWHPGLGPDGTADPDAPKGAYEHAFVVLAASSATLAGHPDGAVLLDRALEALMSRFWEEPHGLVADLWHPDTRRLDPYRGVNANMHTLEALLAASDATGDPAWMHRGLGIATRVVDEFARTHSWRIPEHFDEHWTPLLDYNRDHPTDPFRPFGATVGHWLEWSRLCLHLHAALGPQQAPDWLLDHARSLFETALREGWATDGTAGFVYTVDWDGGPVVRQRMHWVAAEATAAAAALYAATGDQRYATWYQTWWQHIADAFIDTTAGSWHHELDPNLEVSDTVWPGKPDLYHAVQATLLPRLPLSRSLAAGMASGQLTD